MKKDTKIEIISLSQIEADENQPRKNFNPERLSELMKSISRHGIMNPLIVERQSNGKFILVDGERRYRAAKELKLKEVPTVIVEKQNEVERLIQQFHIQEQHEGWSALEKAVAVARLGQEMGVDVYQLAEILSLPRRTVGDYVAFSKLLEKKEYEKNEIPIQYALGINNLKTFVKRKYRDVLNQEFTQDMERALERRIIQCIKAGVIYKKNDILKIQDAVKVDPKSIEKFIKNENMTVDKLFLESKARVAWHFRNIYNNAVALNTHIKKGMEMKVQNLYEESSEKERNVLKSVHKKLGELISQI